MKNIKSGLVAIGVLGTALVAPTTHAAYFDFTSTIAAVGTADPELWGSFDYLLLATGTTAGNCYVDPNSGKVLILLPTPKAYAMALAAQGAGRQVYVSLDDTHVDDTYGYCVMRLMKVLD